MSLPVLNLLSPGEDTVNRWINTFGTGGDLLLDIKGDEKMAGDTNVTLPPQDFEAPDNVNVDPRLLENAQRITTQDLLNIATIPSPSPQVNGQNSRKKKTKEPEMTQGKFREGGMERILNRARPSPPGSVLKMI